MEVNLEITEVVVEILNIKVQQVKQESNLRMELMILPIKKWFIFQRYMKNQKVDKADRELMVVRKEVDREVLVKIIAQDRLIEFVRRL